MKGTGLYTRRRVNVYSQITYRNNAAEGRRVRYMTVDRNRVLNQNDEFDAKLVPSVRYDARHEKHTRRFQ